MISAYNLGSDRVDSVELKALLISRGVHVSSKVYSAYSGRARISSDPLRCNALILPDGTVVQLTDLAFHMAYIKSAIRWNLLSHLRHMTELSTPFSLVLSSDGSIMLRYQDRDVTPVRLPPRSRFYDQTTSQGMPYVGNAVLQGSEWVSFQCLWPCEYAAEGLACQYCYSGGVLESLARRHKPFPRYPSPGDVAEIVEFAIVKERSAQGVQITGGSTHSAEVECRRITEFLRAIDRRVGLSNVPGEILVYATPMTDFGVVDEILAAGADRVSMSVEIWDTDIARKVMPGKSKYVNRREHLSCLERIANKHGIGKACSNFIIGLEPPESCLAGAEYLARRGVVPIASVWMPFGRPVLGAMKAPGLQYYRDVKHGLAEIYCRYGLVPPGGTGLNVCMCRDVYLQTRTLKGLKVQGT